MAEIVKITHLEDTNSNVIAGKRAGLIALATDVGASGEVSMYDSSLNRHRLVTLDDSGDCSSDIASASIDTLTTETTTATESVTTPIIKPAVDSTTALQVTKADGTTAVLNVDTTNLNIGLGTVSPSEKLDIAGNIRAGIKTVATDKSIKLIAEQYDSATETEGALPLFAYNDATGNTVNIGGGSSAQNSATLVRLYAAANAITRTGTEILRAMINGVGIGAVSPTAKLDVLSAENSEPVMRIKGTGTADLLNVMDNTTEVFTILDGGNVGVGVTAPTEKIESSANIKATETVIAKGQEFHTPVQEGSAGDGEYIDIPLTGGAMQIHVLARATKTTSQYKYLIYDCIRDAGTGWAVALSGGSPSVGTVDPWSLTPSISTTNLRLTVGGTGIGVSFKISKLVLNYGWF